MTEIALIDVTDVHGRTLEPTWLERAEPVHRQLRPQLPPEYVAKMLRVFEGGGRMIVAVDAFAVSGIAVWRATENTFAGRYLYVDDLVTDATRRSRGVGKALLARCEAIAAELDCRELVLDSGVQRGEAHKFYFREGLVINAYKFSKPITPRSSGR